MNRWGGELEYFFILGSSQVYTRVGLLSSILNRMFLSNTVYPVSAIYDCTIVIGNVLGNAARVSEIKPCVIVTVRCRLSKKRENGLKSEKTQSFLYFPGQSHLRPEKMFISYLPYLLFC